MEDQLARPLELYRQAFEKFAAIGKNDYLFKDDGAVLAYYHNTTYRISHYQDLLSEFKGYFEPDFSAVYTEISSALWESLFDEYGFIDQENFTIDLYSAWKLYWEGQSESNSKELNQTESRGKLSLLMEAIKLDPENIVEHAEGLDDISLIPVLAMAMRMQFEKEEDFYVECLETLIEEYPENFSDAGHLDLVTINTETVEESFYIYQPDYDFEG